MNYLETVGFIGAGSITAAVARGLRARGANPTIFLSPRSEEVSLELASSLPNVHRTNSNAEVVARAQLVVLAVLPEQLQDALSEVTFRPDQTVVSFVATVPVAEITRLVAPAFKVCRVTPLTTIKAGQGPIVMAPGMASVKSLFDGLGDVLVAENEEQMMAFGCGAAVLSTFFQLEQTVAQWLTSAGVTAANASLYVRSMFAGAANLALASQDVALTAMADGNETPGGLNERVRASLRDAGLFTRIDRVLTELASLSLAPSSTQERGKSVERGSA
jgi:pyrroline-5-carboxylate reductase